MGLFVPGRRAQPRRFSYEPRFYNPEHDDSIKRRMHIQSRARSKRRNSGFIYLVALLAMAIYIYNILG